MGVNYAGLVATANRLIGENGKTGTLRKLVAGGDAWNPSAGTPVDATVTLVEVTQDQMFRGDALVEGASIAALVRVSEGVAPNEGDKLKIGSGRFLEVKKSSPLQPGAIVILYEVQLGE